MLAAAVFLSFFWMRRGWMRDDREALAAGGVDVERDELVETSTANARSMLVLFGVLGGMFVFLGVFMWLARR